MDHQRADQRASAAASRLKWIEDGLHNLVQVVHENDMRSIALPPPGRSELSPAGLVAV